MNPRPVSSLPSEESVQLLLDASRDILLLLDGDSMTILHANAAAVRLLGYSFEKLVGMRMGDLECALTDLFFWDDMAERDYLAGDSAYRCCNGTVLEVAKQVRRVSALPIRFTVCATETQQHYSVVNNLNLMAARLRATLEASDSGILLVDNEGAILNMNHRLSAIWEVPVELLEARNDVGIMAHLQSQTLSEERVSAQFERSTEGEDFLETRHLHNGRVIECSSHAARWRDQLIGRVYFYNDVTQRYRIQETLIAARDEAERANQAKSRFLATMSHEIRTPMNGILGMAQLLLLPHLSDGQRNDYARTILGSGQSLLTLLNDVLDLSKIEAGKFQIDITTVDPEQLVHEIQLLFSGAAKSKGLQLHGSWLGPPGQRYQSDAHRLRQMLLNLVGNAVKFTAQGSIRIEAREINRDSQTALLELAVVDTGIGVPAEKLGLLFKAFSQTDSSTTREFGGSGLGLFLVSTLAKLLGGDVGVESEAGKGSKFWVHVPAKLLAAGDDSRLDERMTSDRVSPVNVARVLTGRILVAEDNVVNQMVIRGLLTQLGLEVSFAEDGQQALALFCTGDAPDAVLMDLNMPVMDGYIATQKIRQWEADHARTPVPIIALTADAFEEDRQRCLAGGMNDFLVKPVSMDALRQTLGKWL